MHREDLIAVVGASLLSAWTGKGKSVRAADLLGRTLLGEQAKERALVERTLSKRDRGPGDDQAPPRRRRHPRGRRR